MRCIVGFERAVGGWLSCVPVLWAYVFVSGRLFVSAITLRVRWVRVSYLSSTCAALVSQSHLVDRSPISYSHKLSSYFKTCFVVVVVCSIVDSSSSSRAASPPGTPLAGFDEFGGDFRAPSPDRVVEPSAPRPPTPAEEIIDLTPKAPPRTRLPRHAGESLQDRVLRVATAISQRRDARKKYADKRKKEKFKCALCDVVLNSNASKQIHLRGRRHQAREKRAEDGPQH